MFAHLRRWKRRIDEPWAVSSAKKSLLAAAVVATVSYIVVIPPFTTLLEIDGMRLYWPIAMSLGNSTVIFVYMFYLFSVQRETAVRTARRVWLIYIAVTLAMIVVFAMNPTSRDYDIGPDGRYQAGGPGDSFAPLAYMLSMTFAAVMNVVVCRLGWRWVRKSRGTRWLAMGLNTNALGQIGGLCMASHQVLYNGALLLGVVPPWTQNIVETPVKGIAGLLTMFGLSATAVILWIRNAKVVVWAHANRARRRLYPLWSELHKLSPRFAVDPPSSNFRDMLRIRDPYKGLINRSIEIGDGRLHLRVPPGTSELARRFGHDAGLQDGPELDAVIEAARLEVGFVVARAGANIRVEVVPVVEASRLVQEGDFATEVRWWTEVQTARSSPVVAQVLTHVPALIKNSTIDSASASR
ncbi:DUF6545 domain-containing protein [Lentzea sp. NPDC092896]|uniref:DUF6545 domain-containing protein n=1 Tax=Lentzea sp. NPDC092896 TaxID=3364127 RepID=UPI00381A2514